VAAWLECLPSGIRESKRLALFVEWWSPRAARKVGKFMLVREDEKNISMDDDIDEKDT
jgi:hypothetical protein